MSPQQYISHYRYLKKLFLSAIFLFYALISSNISQVHALAPIEKIDEAGPQLSNSVIAPFIYPDTHTTGDYNNDGYLDIAFSDRQLTSNTGAIYVLYGTVDGSLPTSPDETLLGSGANGWFGYNLLTGDVNQDGISDLLVTHLGHNSGAGAIKIYFGGEDFLNSTPDLILTNDDIPGFGHTIAKGDFNNDNIDDFLVGSPTTNSNKGTISVYLGPISEGDDPVWSYSSPIAGSLGWYVITSDVNQDGYDDVVASTTSAGNRVEIFLSTGTNFGSVADFTIAHTGSGSATGNSMSNFFNITPNAEYLVLGNVSISTSTGLVRLYETSSAFNTTEEQTYNGETTNSWFGYHLKELGDLNNDGLNEFAIGALAYPSNTRKGRVYVYEGGETIPTMHAEELDGETNGDRFSVSVDVGDWNHNGWNDFIVAAPGYPSGAYRVKLYLYELAHGHMNLSANLVSGGVNQATVIDGTATNSTGYGVAGVQWSYGNTTTSTWNDCTANDGAFDSDDEDYTCLVTSSSNTNIYIRSYDNNTTYTPVTLYKRVSLTSVSDYISTTSTPGCSSSPPGIKAPTIYQVTSNSSTSIKLYFSSGDDPIDHYSLVYGTSSNDYQYGNLDIGDKDTRVITIDYLNPNTTYYFRVVGMNGCATGPWSNEYMFTTNSYSSSTTNQYIDNTNYTTTSGGDTSSEINNTDNQDNTDLNNANNKDNGKNNNESSNTQVLGEHTTTSIFTKIFSFIKHPLTLIALLILIILGWRRKKK